MTAFSVSALILAGGRATRMGGIAKHEIVVGGETILARQTRTLRPLVGEILVSATAAIEGHRTVHDAPAHAGIGPLAGIAAGLDAASTDWVLVVAGDMPYLSAPLIARMLELAAAAADDVHAIGIERDGLPEPLFSVVRTARARGVVTAMIAARDYKASRLLDALGAMYIDEQHARACDPELSTLRNINEPGDLP